MLGAVFSDDEHAVAPAYPLITQFKFGHIHQAAEFGKAEIAPRLVDEDGLRRAGQPSLERFVDARRALTAHSISIPLVTRAHISRSLLACAASTSGPPRQGS